MIMPWKQPNEQQMPTPFLDANKQRIFVDDMLIFGKNPTKHTVAKVYFDPKYYNHFWASVKVRENWYITYTLEAFLEMAEKDGGAFIWNNL